MANALVAELVKRFKTIHTTPPKWAWQFKPSIPLIGEKYKPGKGLLIYALRPPGYELYEPQNHNFLDNPDLR